LSGEERPIARYFRPLAKHPAALGLLDDTAALEPPAGCDLVLKTDGLISGVHFFPDDPEDAVGKKALRVNLSDLAAKGARPLGFLLALALPREVDPAWLELFARGLGEDAELFKCPLLGGDTDCTPGPLSISIAALGAVPHGKMVRRSGPRPGDRVVVTGTIGDAMRWITRHGTGPRAFDNSRSIVSPSPSKASAGNTSGQSASPRAAVMKASVNRRGVPAPIG
jgi:thiamine-monophosphate kinase